MNAPEPAALAPSSLELVFRDVERLGARLRSQGHGADAEYAVQAVAKLAREQALPPLVHAMAERHVLASMLAPTAAGNRTQRRAERANDRRSR